MEFFVLLVVNWTGCGTNGCCTVEWFRRAATVTGLRDSRGGCCVRCQASFCDGSGVAGLTVRYWAADGDGTVAAGLLPALREHS